MYAKYVYKQSTGSLIPVMTSNTTTADLANPAKVVMTCSSISSASYEPYKAVDGSHLANSTGWLTPSSITTGWIQVNYIESQVTHYSYSITARASNADSPKSWTYLGSNDGINWDTLDTQTNVSTWGAQEMRTYTIASPSAYYFYRINITASQGSTYVGIVEWQAWGSDGVISYHNSLLNDIVAILTGETNVNTLSTCCDKDNSYILNSVTDSGVPGDPSKGWSIHDDAAIRDAYNWNTITGICLKAPYHDDPTKYVYAVVEVGTGTGEEYINIKVYENWDATTHIGTNISKGSDARVGYAQQYSFYKGMLLLSASPNHIHCFSFVPNTWGASSSGSTGVFQRTRKSPMDTVANGYPPVIWANLHYGIQGTGGPNASAPRIFTNYGTDLVDTISLNCSIPFGVATNVTLPSMDKNRFPVHLMQHIGVTGDIYGFMGGDISSLCDTWLVTSNYGGNLDEITFKGNTYVIWGFSGTGNHRVAVRKG